MRKLQHLARPYLPLFLITLLAMAALSGVTLIATEQIREATDAVLAGTSLNLDRMIPLIAVLLAGGMLASWFASSLGARFSLYTVRDVRERAAAKINQLPFAYFDEKGSGALLSKLTGDIDETSAFLSGSLPEFSRTVIAIIGYAAYLLTINVRLTLVSMVAFPAIMVIVSFVSKRLARLSRDRLERMDDLAGEVTDACGGLLVEKSYNLQNAIADKLDRAVDRALKPDVDRQKVIAVTSMIFTVSQWLPLFACCIYAGFTAFGGGISTGSLVAFTLLLGSLTGPVSELPFILTEMRQQGVSIAQLDELLALAEETGGDRPVAAPPRNADAAIAFQHVGFSYGKNPVLRDISFEVPQGKHVAFVGHSGCGKTTLFKLLLGFYPPESGEYKLYDEAFAGLDLTVAREQFALVSQDVFLFPDTIERNIALGRPGSTKEEIVEAAKAAGIHDFITGLPEGYQSLVGERGIKLSGGERQRISIARAFLKNAPILLLDEPTAALDSASEAIIERSLRVLGENHTVLIIAHRLSTIQDADVIYVIDEGRVAEQGTHGELLAKESVYAALYRSQEKEATKNA